MRSPFAFAFATLLFACGENNIQHAVVSPVATQQMSSPNANATPAATNDAQPSSPSIASSASEEGARHFIVTPKTARLTLSAVSPLGTQTFTFRRFSARTFGQGDRLSFQSHIDTSSLEGGAPGFASFVRADLLEVGRYPTATFDGDVTRGEDGACTVIGQLTLHGVTRALRFDGVVSDEGDDVRLRATFDVPRKEFAIIAPAGVEAFVPNDVRVSMDVVARREHVTPEEIQ